MICQTGERINIVNEYKLSTGQPLTGSMPFGFKIEIDENTRRKKIIKDPEQEDIVDDLLQYMFKHQSKRKALSYIHAKYHISMTHTSLSKLLNNTLLCGEYRGNKSYNEGYITREEFDRLQYIVSSNIKQYAEKRDYYFSGLIKCPNCNYRLAGHSQRCRTKEGNEYKYKKYRCANFSSHHRCNFNKAVSENVIEKMLLKNINKYLEDARIRVREIKDADLTVIPKYNVDEINAEIDRLNYSWRSGKLRSIEEYDIEYDELLAKLDMAEAERDVVITKDFDKIEKILENGWREIYKNLDAAHKRAFWRSFISSIEINWTTNKKDIVRINFL